MNTRARVKALPVVVAASLGLGSFTNLRSVLAHPGHVHSAPNLQPTGLEELNLTIEETGVTGMPESVEAGRYLVKVTGPEPGEMEQSGVIFVQFPEGLSVEQAFEDTQAAEGAPPEWYLDVHFGGGVILTQGTESWAVIDLTPGTWAVTTSYGTTLAVEFDVTGEFPVDTADVEANATIDLLEMTIRIADGALVAGDNVITVNNAGAQLHFLDVNSVPDGTTEEQVQAVIDSFMTGTPPADDNGLAESDFGPVVYSPDISPGVKMTMPLSLEPGTYFLSCWVPDSESFAPHAMMGMWELIVIE